MPEVLAATHAASNDSVLNGSANNAGDVHQTVTVSAKWFIKRAMIGLVVLTTSVSGMAVLLHAAIDPHLDTINTSGTLLNTLVKMAGKL